MPPSVVLVTASAAGLGRETARQLAAAVATVFLSARDPQKAARAAAELAADGDVRALAAGLDVTDAASVAAAAAELQPRSDGWTSSSTTPRPTSPGASSPAARTR